MSFTLEANGDDEDDKKDKKAKGEKRKEEPPEEPDSHLKSMTLCAPQIIMGCSVLS